MAHITRPPYQDPASGVRYDCNNPDFSGYLTKQSSWLKDWRRRFFILKGSKLFFAKVKSAEQKTHKRNALEVSTQDTTFFMFAGTEKEKDDWIGAIGRAIVKSSSTYQQEDNSADSDSEYEYS